MSETRRTGGSFTDTVPRTSTLLSSTYLKITEGPLSVLCRTCTVYILCQIKFTENILFFLAPGVCFEVVKVANVSLGALYTGKRERD